MVYDGVSRDSTTDRYYYSNALLVICKMRSGSMVSSESKEGIGFTIPTKRGLKVRQEDAFDQANSEGDVLDRGLERRLSVRRLQVSANNKRNCC